MEISANFEINKQNKINEIKFIETFNYKTMDDKITEINYENTIKKNIADIIVRKLISNLSRMK